MFTIFTDWDTREGAVSSVEATGPHGVFGGYHSTRFRVAGAMVQYSGKPLLLCDGDRVAVVGIEKNGLLHACFVAAPGLGWSARPYSGVPFILWALVLFVLGSLVVAKVAVLLGLFLVAWSASLLFRALSWFEGERQARGLMRRASPYQPRPGS